MKWLPTVLEAAQMWNKKLAVRRFDVEVKKRAWISLTQFVHQETKLQIFLCVLGDGFIHWHLWMITLGMKDWKYAGLSTGMSWEGRCHTSWFGTCDNKSYSAVRWESWWEIKASNMCIIITCDALLPVTLVKLAK